MRRTQHELRKQVRGPAHSVEADHRLAVPRDVQRDRPGHVDRQVAPTQRAVDAADHDVQPVGKARHERDRKPREVLVGRDDHPGHASMPTLQVHEGLDHGPEVRLQFLASAARQQRDPRRAARQVALRRGEFGFVEAAVDHRVADECGLHPALTEPFLLERQQAEPQVGEPPQLRKPPPAPRPHLRRHQVHRPDAARTDRLDDREVRRRAVDRYVEHHAIRERPLRDLAPDPAHHVDLAEPGQAHRAVLRGDADHLGPRLTHARTAPGGDAEAGIELEERADHRSGVGIAGRLEGREEDRPGRCAMRRCHAPERSREPVDRVG